MTANEWAKAIAERLSDEWDGKSEFPQVSIQICKISIPDSSW